MLAGYGGIPLNGTRAPWTRQCVDTDLRMGGRMQVIHGDAEVDRFDLIVIGSGAGGLTAAATAARHGARVLVLEKSMLLGGTSAVSGGMIWVPGTRHATSAGVVDDMGAAHTYVGAVARGRGRAELWDAALQAGPAAVAFLEDECGLQFSVLEDFPDYRQDLPGAAVGGRTLEPSLWDSTELGTLREHLRGDGRAPFTMQEYEAWGAFTKFPWDELDARVEQGLYAKGRALVGSLLASCVRDGVTLAVDARVGAITTDGRRVSGVELSDGSLFRGRRVVVASGGFEWDVDLADSLVASRIETMCSPPSNTGDGLRLAMRLGVMVRGTREAWWAPMAVIGDERDGQPIGTLLRFERQGPGSIMVDRRGERFANESQNYNDLARALHSWDPTEHAPVNAPVHIVVDDAYMQRYGMFDHRAGSPVPPYLISAPTLEELAVRIDVPADRLASTVARFNADAALGVDDAFGRGESAYDRYWGDRDSGWPNPSLAPLERGPYYALPVANGVFGTNGGIATNGDGDALDVDGTPIPGLSAVGNVTESPYAAGYPGAGATLGPILALGYRIGGSVTERS